MFQKVLEFRQFNASLLLAADIFRKYAYWYASFSHCRIDLVEETVYMYE